MWPGERRKKDEQAETSPVITTMGASPSSFIFSPLLVTCEASSEHKEQRREEGDGGRKFAATSSEKKMS